MPKGEQRKVGKCGEGIGSAILPAASSLFSLAVTIWGCSLALFKLGDSKGRLYPINLIGKSSMFTLTGVTGLLSRRMGLFVSGVGKGRVLRTWG